jgi:RND family efflux transporter MFP subunit
LTAVLVAEGCSRNAPTTVKATRATQLEPVVDVETTRARLGSILQRVRAPGTLAARRQSQIGTDVGGRIVRVQVSEGERVKAGDPLFQIDPQQYEIALRQAEAGVDLARAERRQIESDLARATTLMRQDVIAAQEIERLTTSLATVRAKERQAKEVVAFARHNLERTTVRAPYDGSIAERLADEGTTALVQPQTIIVVLQETARLEAHAAIPESQLALVQVGDRAIIHVEGLDEPLETGVSAVSDTIDPATRTYLVKMPVSNADYRLKAGVFAHVEILPGAKSNVLLVPRDSVRTEDGDARLLLVRDGRVEAVPIEVGVVAEDAVEILHGASIGDEVVVGDAARTIAPSMRVRVVDALGSASKESGDEDAVAGLAHQPPAPDPR